MTDEQRARLSEARGVRVLTNLPGEPAGGLAGTYELTAHSWDEPVIVARKDPLTGVIVETANYVRHSKGDLVTLTDKEARRLLSAGAVAVPGVREAQQLAQMQQVVRAQEVTVKAVEMRMAEAAAMRDADLTDEQRALAEIELSDVATGGPSVAPGSGQQ